MNGVAVVAAVASGTMLPLMDIVFGQFVTVFNDFAIGALSPEDYRKEVNKATYVVQLRDGGEPVSHSYVQGYGSSTFSSANSCLSISGRQVLVTFCRPGSFHSS